VEDEQGDEAEEAQKVAEEAMEEALGAKERVQEVVELVGYRLAKWAPQGVEEMVVYTIGEMRVDFGKLEKGRPVIPRHSSP
jgi:phosphoribosyl-ATP pyrophosphohydrolase